MRLNRWVLAWSLVAIIGLSLNAWRSGPTLAQFQGPQDPCFSSKKTNLSITTASGNTQLVAGVPNQRVFVCSFALVVPSAVAVSITEGPGLTCGSVTGGTQAAVMGVAAGGTAANGMSFASNGGLTIGGGGGTIAQTAYAGNYLCLLQSGTVQLAGNITYVQTQQ